MTTQPHKPTLVITGGNFVNKGAESMLMSTVNAIRVNFPNYEPVLLDLFPTVKSSEKGHYSFRIVNMHVRSLFRICFPFLKLLFKPKVLSNSESEIKEALNSASGIFDISGYGLSSHNQQLMWSIAYLLPIYMAKKKGIPVWLLPQSMGPFRFRGIKKWLFRFLAVPVLQYPEIIFVREPSGLAAVRQFRVKPTELSADLVLQVPERNAGVGVADDAPVLVIPNQQLFRVVGKAEALQLYEALIRQVLDRNIPVKVVRHSNDDQTFCDLLNSRFSNSLLTIQDKPLSLEALQMEMKISRFVISGRYHGAIHALKLFKPVIIIGWAEKYRHLATMFALEKLLIDLSSGVVPSRIDEVVEVLLADEQVFIRPIKDRLALIEQDNVWKRIQLK